MIWYVALGSALGGAARYALSTWLERTSGSSFPTGTLVVNVSGSFLLGLILRYALETPGIGPELRLALTVGFCGGYTTFATFGYETVVLLEAGDWRRAAIYMAASVVASLAGVLAGILLARQLLVWRGSA